MFHVLTLTYVQPLDVVDRGAARAPRVDQREMAAGRLMLAGRQEWQQGGLLVTGDMSTEDAET